MLATRAARTASVWRRTRVRCRRRGRVSTPCRGAQQQRPVRAARREAVAAGAWCIVSRLRGAVQPAARAWRRASRDNVTVNTAVTYAGFATIVAARGVFDRRATTALFVAPACHGARMRLQPRGIRAPVATLPLREAEMGRVAALAFTAPIVASGACMVPASLAGWPHDRTAPVSAASSGVFPTRPSFTYCDEQRLNLTCTGRRTRRANVCTMAAIFAAGETRQWPF